MARVHGAVPDAHVLVVDDASPDGTGDLVERMAADDPKLHQLRPPGKAGLGSAYRAGFRWGAAERFDVLVEMDADLSHDPAALPSLLARVDDGADLAIGSRYVPGGGVSNWSRDRLLLSRFANAYVRIATGLSVRDATAGYRCWRRTVSHSIST